MSAKDVQFSIPPRSRISAGCWRSLSILKVRIAAWVLRRPSASTLFGSSDGCLGLHCAGTLDNLTNLGSDAMSRIDRHTLLYAFGVASVTSILPAHAGTAAKVAACLSSKIVQCPAALRTVPTMFCAGFHPFSHATPVLFWTFSKADAGAAVRLRFSTPGGSHQRHPISASSI